MLQSGPAHNRRAAAEALGRIGSSKTIAPLLSAISKIPSDDRFLEHSLIYAAIELNDADAIREMIADDDPVVRRAALIALDQIEGNEIRARDIQSLLVSENALLNDVAWWIARQHPNWGETVVAHSKLN